MISNSFFARSGARAIASALFLVAIAGPAAADRLDLVDGSQLNGTIRGLSPEHVKFETSYAGEIQVRRETVSGIATEKPMMVTLRSGERLLGELLWSEQRGQRLNSALLGEVSLADVEIVDIGPADGVAAASGAVDAGAEARIEALEREYSAQLAAAQEASAPTAESVWSGQASIAANGASGNTEEFSATPRFSARRETEFDRLTLGLQGRFASQDGEETENEIIGTIGLERDFSPRWFAFTQLRLERDEFEDLDLRANVDLGAGYFVIREDNQVFKPRAGLGLQTEAFSTSSNSENFVGVLGWDYRYDPSESWQFTHTLDYRPTFSDPTGAYRIDSEAALSTALDGTGPWRLELRLRNEFNADPEPGIDELDTIYSVGLQRKFE